MSHKVIHKVTKWNPERDAKLVTLFESKLHPNDIAVEMGASRAAVEARYRAIRKERQSV